MWRGMRFIVKYKIMAKDINRRNFLKMLGIGAVATGAALTGCKHPADKVFNTADDYKNQGEPPVGKMTYRINPRTNTKVSLLGYGMMRLPKIEDGTDSSQIDQKMVNKLVAYAFQHGVNYYDTSPAYSQGQSEKATGIALKPFPRNKYYIATKLSNFDESQWGHDASVDLYHQSFKELGVEYIDYYLLHSVGQGGYERFRKRFVDNGMIDYLVKERKAGRIRNLGFSFHGDVKAFNWLVDHHDQYHWDFAQIELNYMDWDYANAINPDNQNAKWLYQELVKRHIPVVVMEPLLGGRLSDIPQYLTRRLKERDPHHSVASWAFRYAGTWPEVLTCLSGMTYMEHLRDNLLTFSPLKPVSASDEKMLYEVAKEMMGMNTIPCNDCKYCMPCPYGIDIPANFVHYNKCINEGRMPRDEHSKEYARYRREFLIGVDRVIPRERQADHCIGCKTCVPHCPQSINIPEELHKIADFVEQLKRTREV